MKPIATTAAALTLLLLISTLLYVTQPPKVVVFDIQGTLERYQDSLIQSEVTNEAQLIALRQFDRTLREVLEEYAKAHNLVILVPGALISGAPDLTVPIQHQVIETIKAKKKA